jgi:hypothetical protein
MKFRGFRYALSSCVAAASLAACGGPQPPNGAPVGMPQSPAIAVPAKHPDHPVARPTVLDFHSEHPLTFVARQSGYYGRFSISDHNCVSIATVSPKWANGPRATFKVTPVKTASGGTCVVSVTDSQKHTAKVTVNNPGY